MKNINIITSLFLMIPLFSISQVGIGTDTVPESTILTFAQDNRGIILPAVTSAPIGLNESKNGGTFIFDSSDSKVKVFEGETGAWIALSGTGSTTAIVSNGATETGNGVIIGSETTEAQGVLVLEASDKAMILPKINKPEETVKSAYPGMLCYDTSRKSLAVYDGVNWNYWN